MGSVVRYRRGTGSTRVKTGADVVTWLGTDAPFSFPGFTSSFDNSTVGPVEPDHHRDQSRNERQTNNQKQSGRHDVWLLFCASSFAFRRSLMALRCFRVPKTKKNSSCSRSFMPAKADPSSA